jgi:hypothetical protein
MIFLSSLTLCNASSFLTLYVQLIFSILLQYHMGISDLVSEVSKFQHRRRLCSSCSILLLCAPCIRYGLAWDRTRTFVVRRWQRISYFSLPLLPC